MTCEKKFSELVGNIGVYGNVIQVDIQAFTNLVQQLKQIGMWNPFDMKGLQEDMHFHVMSFAYLKSLELLMTKADNMYFGMLAGANTHKNEIIRNMKTIVETTAFVDENRKSAAKQFINDFTFPK